MVPDKDQLIRRIRLYGIPCEVCSFPASYLALYPNERRVEHSPTHACVLENPPPVLRVPVIPPLNLNPKRKVGRPKRHKILERIA